MQPEVFFRSQKTTLVHTIMYRNPKKGCSPFPVAKYLTCDHTTASMHFFKCFSDRHAQQHSQKHKHMMVICVGSMVHMPALSLVFAPTNLHFNERLQHMVGDGTSVDFSQPIQRRLNHIMKNSKTVCKKSKLLCNLYVSTFLPYKYLNSRFIFQCPGQLQVVAHVWAFGYNFFPSGI